MEASIAVSRIRPGWRGKPETPFLKQVTIETTNTLFLTAEWFEAGIMKCHDFRHAILFRAERHGSVRNSRYSDIAALPRPRPPR